MLAPGAEDIPSYLLFGSILLLSRRLWTPLTAGTTTC